MTGKEVSSLVILGLAGLYGVSPVDIIPDIPVVGWVDDFLIIATAVLNCIQQFTAESIEILSNIAKTLKWICIIGGGIIILLLGLLAAFIIKSVS